MKTIEMLKQIKTMLKSRLGLAQMTLEDGETVIEAESFAEGEAIFIVSDDERIALPIGEYTKSDGGIIVVTEEGTIAEIRDDMQEEKMQDGEEIKEEKLEDVVVEDVPEESAAEIESIVAAVVDVIAPIIAEVKDQVEELKKKLETIPEAEEEGYKDGIADEKEDEKQKMSRQAPASKALKHNPETANRKAAQTLYSQNAGTHTTKDRVFNKLFNQN
jgi:hypothetical protein